MTIEDIKLLMFTINTPSFEQADISSWIIDGCVIVTVYEKPKGGHVGIIRDAILSKNYYFKTYDSLYGVIAHDPTKIIRSCQLM